MFVLNLRHVKPPHTLMAVARSDNKEALTALINRSFIESSADFVHHEGESMRVFKQDGPLADFCVPSPTDEQAGIIDMGTLEDRIRVALISVEADVRAQVTAAWKEVEENTLIV